MTDTFDYLRKAEYSRLDTNGHIYLDYTGSGLYSESQIRAHAEMLQTEVMGNPHSENPTSLAATRRVENTRDRIREFFNADYEEYEVIFTLNASGALKLVGEGYPFEPGSHFKLLSDNHNSVNGIREFAAARRAVVTYLPLNGELRVDDVKSHLVGVDPLRPNLFAYPAQSNFSGVKHPLEWVALAKDLGYDVLLDTAAYAPTNPLSLRDIRPDFVCLSFYKMFGYPTGVGALIARREALRRLRRPWFSGGTVRFASAQNKLHLLEVSSEAFEDGTLNFLSIAAVPIGLDFLDRVGMENIKRHVTGLTAYLLEELLALKHSNGAPLVQLYGPRTTENRGGTATFNVLSPRGVEIDSKLVEAQANKAKISLRTGCFCNPGVAERSFNYNAVDAFQCLHEFKPREFTLRQFSACMRDKPVGAVRVSLGIASNKADVDRFIDFMCTFRDIEPLRHGVQEAPEIIGG